MNTMSRRLVELHRHLEGSIRLATVVEVAASWGWTTVPHDVDGCAASSRCTPPWDCCPGSWNDSICVEEFM